MYLLNLYVSIHSPLYPFIAYHLNLVLSIRYIMCQRREDLLRTANWPGVKGGARERLMDQLQGIDPFLALPCLEQLIVYKT